MSHRVLLRLLLLLCCTTAGLAHAASFDCKRARGEAETTICADRGLSRLDDDMAAAYAGLRKATADGAAEQAMQRAWLKARNACADAACLRRSYDNRIAELRARTASRSAMVGVWKVVFGCSNVREDVLARCRQGERDVFKLAIAVAGDKVCIHHMATGQLGYRIDELADGAVLMTGTLDAKNAQVRFRSRFGGSGSAMLRVEANTLRWRVTDKDGQESWIPDQAVLSRVAAGAADPLPACR